MKPLARGRWARWLPWFLSILSLGGMAGPIVVGAMEWREVGFGVVFVIFALVGAVLASRVPGNSIGWILGAVGALGGLGGIASAYQAYADLRDLPGATTAGWSASWMWAPMLGLAFIPLLLLFPTGRPLTPRWRWVLWLAGGFIVLAVAGNGLYPWPPSEGGPNPYGIEGGERVLTLFRDLAGLMLIVGLVASVVSLVVRYRRGNRFERQQLKWFLTAAATLPVAVVVGELGDQELQPVVMPLALALLAMAIGVAVLRHRLYDIDLVINRALVYGALTILLGLVYAGSVVALGGLVRPLAGSNDLAVAGSTLAVAALFSPARGRIQGLVDRRFYRSRYDAVRTVEAFSFRLRNEVDLENLWADLVGVMQGTLQPASMSVWLRESGAAMNVGSRWEPDHAGAESRV